MSGSVVGSGATTPPRGPPGPPSPRTPALQWRQRPRSRDGPADHQYLTGRLAKTRLHGRWQRALFFFWLFLFLVSACFFVCFFLLFRLFLVSFSFSLSLCISISILISFIFFFFFFFSHVLFRFFFGLDRHFFFTLFYLVLPSFT